MEESVKIIILMEEAVVFLRKTWIFCLGDVKQLHSQIFYITQSRNKVCVAHFYIELLTIRNCDVCMRENASER